MNLICTAILSLLLIEFCYAGENQWSSFVIENHTKKSLFLTDVTLHYGKWYRSGCKACELLTVEQVIGPGSHTLINAAGRLLSPTGTEGEFSIYDGDKQDKTTTQICHVYFSVPYLIGTENTVSVRPFNMEQYPIELFGGRVKGTYLGVVTIKIHDKDATVN